MTLQVNGNALTLSQEPVAEMEEAAPRSRRRRRTPLDRTRHRRRGRQARGRGRQAARAGLGVSLLGAELHAAALAVVGRARSRPRRAPRRRAAAAHRRPSLGRRDRRLLRRRAVEPAVARRSASAASRSPVPTSGRACRRRCWAPPRRGRRTIRNTLKALIKALIEACQWLDEPANRAEAARILSSPRYLNMPAEVMSRTLDLPDFHVFHRNARQLPVAQPCRLVPGADGALEARCRPTSTSRRVADRVYRTDIYRAAAREMGVDCPEADRLPPGGHGEPPASPAAGCPPIQRRISSAFTFRRLR